MDTDMVAMEAYCWTGWPTRPVFSIYWWHGELAHRGRKAKFDLTDNWAWATGYTQCVRFGIASLSTRGGQWTHEELLRQEENIHYDLSEDGYKVEINRVKGLGLPRTEEALWELHIYPI